MQPSSTTLISRLATQPLPIRFRPPGEKLVTVTAAGLHQIVKALANGSHYGSTGELPFIPGVDGVGRLEDGKRVFFGATRSPYGTFSERALAPSWMSIELPEGLDDVTAAGIANPGMSSWVALSGRAKFVAGESVLILGATGVAGQLAVQICQTSWRALCHCRRAQSQGPGAAEGPWRRRHRLTRSRARHAGRGLSPGSGTRIRSTSSLITSGDLRRSASGCALAQRPRESDAAPAIRADRRNRRSGDFSSRSHLAQLRD